VQRGTDVTYPVCGKSSRRALNARRIAIVGASQDQLSIGMGPVYNLLSSRFEGEVLPVNPKYDSILGHSCYPDIESIDPPPDVAILMVNQHLALEMAERAGKHGTGAVIIVVGGFSEVRPRMVRFSPNDCRKLQRRTICR